MAYPARRADYAPGETELAGVAGENIEGDRFYLEVARLLLARRLVSLTGLAEALRARADWGHDLADILVAQGHVRRIDYYRAVADVYGLRFVDLGQQPVDPELTSIDDRQSYAERNLIPWRREGDRVVIATTAITPAHFEWAAARFGASGFDFVITSPSDIVWQTQTLFREWDSFFAREALYAWKPEDSARHVLADRQRIALATAVAALLLALIVAPAPTLIGLMATATGLYSLSFAFKFVLVAVGADRRLEAAITDEAVAAAHDADMPVYSVLVPLHRAAGGLPLAEALRQIDYPASKLDVKLVLEEDDDETIEAVKALKLPGNFEIVRVPVSAPRTRAKACNYALQFCRGDLVTIYDADDQPAPDQLKKAVLAFRHGDPRLACVQGQLGYFNRDDNWLTRLSALEYSQWFDFLMPGLDRLKAPIPLGATANHFRLAALRQAGGWDPYNRTEDTDLGIRLARQGFAVGVVNSTTRAKASGMLGKWIRLRARRVEGNLQTWLVHSRHPLRLWRALGTRGFLSFQLFVGAPPFAMLLAPLLWAITALIVLTRLHDFGWRFPEPFGTMAFFNLVLGNLFLVYFGLVAAVKRRHFDLVAVSILLPFYWVLHAIAAYRGAWQLMSRPDEAEAADSVASRAPAQPDPGQAP